MNIKEGDQIKVSRFIQGQWLYMGIYGGFESRLVLGSRSFYPEITEKKQLIKGDQLPYKMVSHAPTNIFSSLKTNAKRWESPFVSAYPGPEWKYLNDSQKMWLSEKTFTLSEEINRMAYQLSEKLNNDLTIEVPIKVLYQFINYVLECPRYVVFCFSDQNFCCAWVILLHDHVIIFWE